MIKIGDSNYLEVKDYAKEKGKTVQTVYNWIKSGNLKTRLLLGKTLVKM